MSSKETDSVNLLDKPEEKNRNAKANKGKDVSPTPDPTCYHCHGDHQHKALKMQFAIIARIMTRVTVMITWLV